MRRRSKTRPQCCKASCLREGAVKIRSPAEIDSGGSAKRRIEFPADTTSKRVKGFGRNMYPGVQPARHGVVVAATCAPSRISTARQLKALTRTRTLTKPLSIRPLGVTGPRRRLTRPPLGDQSSTFLALWANLSFYDGNGWSPKFILETKIRPNFILPFTTLMHLGTRG